MRPAASISIYLRRKMNREDITYFMTGRRRNWFRKYFGIWDVIDQIAHGLHLPKKLQNKICDKFDGSLGF